MDNRCVVCGAIIPEGRYVCPCCEAGYRPIPDDKKNDKTSTKESFMTLEVTNR